LLDASQFQSGRLTFNYEITDLRDVAREVLESCCEQLRVKSSKTTIELDQPALVLCDRFRMEQVMMNLLSNAMKYGAGREIQIRVEAHRGRIRVESLLNAGSTFTVELPLADAEVGTGNEASL